MIDVGRLRKIITSRDRTVFEDDCMCVPADRSYDGKDHKCAMHADIEWANWALDRLCDDPDAAERKTEANVLSLVRSERDGALDLLERIWNEGPNFKTLSLTDWLSERGRGPRRGDAA